MAKFAVIWMVVWARVSFAAMAKEYFLSRTVHGICVPLNMQTSQTTYRTVSRILCAMLCTDKGAPKFSFTNGNNCTLYGEGGIHTSSRHTFLALPPSDALEDVATGKPANASSFVIMNDKRRVPADAVDIDTNGKGTRYASEEEEHSWWLLDLGETRTIHAVEILSRQDHLPERLHDVEIRVANNSATNYEDFSHYIYFSTYVGPYSADQGRLSCVRADGVSGRFVAIMRVKPNDKDRLVLVDVNVLVRKG